MRTENAQCARVCGYTGRTVRRWQKAYLDGCRGLRAPTTIKASRAGIERFVRYLEATGTPLTRVTDGTCEAWIQAMIDEGVAVSSAKLYFGHARTWMLWCRQNGVQIPFQDKVRLPRSNRKERPVLREQTLALYMQAARTIDEPYRTAIQLLPLTGMRVGELVKLRLADITLEGAWVVIRVMGKGGKERSIPVLQAGKPILAEFLRDVRPSLGNSEWLFPNPTGRGPIGVRVMQQRMAKLRKAMGVDQLTPHVLRHTYATILAEGGITTLDLQKLLGHSSPATTSHYYHQQPTSIARKLDQQVSTRWADEGDDDE